MINKTIIKALKPLSIPVYFATRGENNNFPLVVFNVLENPKYYGNAEHKLTEYEVMLNLYVDKNKVFDLIKKVEDNMTANGFILGSKVSAIWDTNLNVFNQPLEFKIWKDEGEE